jgi:large subunit ribosomal protein L31e
LPESGSWVYVINLSRVYWGRRTNRADRAIRLIRRFVQRHTKADKVLIDNEVNMYVWRRSREKPPRRVKVLVTIYEEEGEEGEGKVRVARVRLAGPKLKPGPYQPRSQQG